MSNQSTILRLINPFWKKFFPSSTSKYGRQWLAVDSKKNPLPNWSVQWDDRRYQDELFSKEHLRSHFLAKPHYTQKHLPAKNGGGSVPSVFGAYGVSLNFNNEVRPVGIDADSIELIDLFEEYLRPQLEAYGIEYVEEYSGVDNDRRHYWFFLDDIDIKWSNALLDQFLFNAQRQGAKSWFPEQYPYGGSNGPKRENALFRLPFGLYLKTMEVNYGQFKGKEFDNLEDGIEAFLQCQTVSLDKLKEIIKDAPKKEKKVYEAPTKLILKPTSDLIVPKDLPPYIAEVGKKCQAVHGLLHEIQDPEATVDHEVGLGLAAMATFNDNIFKTQEGKDWLLGLPEGVNSPEQNLLYYYPKRGGTPTCNTWENLLGKCEGCPYKGSIKNPRQLYGAETIERKKIGERRIGSLETIREEVFPQLNTLIDEALASGTRTDLLLKTIKNSGKSWLADKIAQRLSKEGKKVCISCNSTKVALEHKGRIEFNEDGTPTGHKAFIMASFDAIFDKNSEEFKLLSGGVVCPNYENIKDLLSLGVDSSYPKNKYCKNCPFYEECNYPRQYSQVQEEKYDIVIIQHAHLACTEVIRQLFAKSFDILIIDEAFVDSITTQLIPTAEEIELLESLENPPEWVRSLLKWLRGGNYPGFKIKPLRSDLKPILAAHLEKEIPYRLDQFLRLYNEDEYMDKAVGVMKFTPVPETTVRLLTDATPTLEELQIVLDNPDIIVVDNNMVLDPSVYHPDSKTYQILDGRASKAEMLKKEELYEYLEWIGDLMMGKYKGLTALITVHMEAEQDCWDWMIRNYPDIVPRIQINHMAVGTNEWAHFNVQFILAAPYINYKQVREAVYRLNFIRNYWAIVHDRPRVKNWYPGHLTDSSKGELLAKTTWKIHRDGVYEYPQFTYLTSPDLDEQLIWRRLGSRVSQANRIRHRLNKQTVTYFLDNTPFDDVLVDQILTKQEILGPIRD